MKKTIEGGRAMKKTLAASPRASRAMRRALAAATTAGLLCGLMAVTPGAGAQAVRGLVIGIDDYAHIEKLQGAVNDARDIGEALDGIGVDDLTVLLDGDATRDRIVAEWRGLLERAAPGDTLVLAYAGHGAQEPERVPGTEPGDGKDEVLLLGGFRSEGSGTRERIVDDEINWWFLDAGRKGLRVVFVADACHSGTPDARHRSARAFAHVPVHAAVHVERRRAGARPAGRGGRHRGSGGR